MADNEKFKRPGTFEKGKKYLIDGGRMLAWLEWLEQDRVIAGPNIRENQTPKGRVFTGMAGGGNGPDPNAFFRVYQTPEDGPTPAKWWLQGGQVTGGTGNEPVADIELGEVESPPSDGDRLWLEVTGNGIKVDGLLYGGFNVTAADTTTAASPSNTIPTAEDHTGKKFHLYLGNWVGGVFQPMSGGHLNVGFCGGAYTPSRF